MSAVADRPHVVYVFRDKDDAPLYVGSTSTLTQRVRQHRTEKAWFGDVARVEVESEHDNKALACLREAELIDTLHPVHNQKSGNRRLWAYYARHGYPSDDVSDEDDRINAAVDRALSGRSA